MIRIVRIKGIKEFSYNDCNVRAAKLNIKFKNSYSNDISLNLCTMCAGAFTLDLKRILQDRIS